MGDEPEENKVESFFAKLIPSIPKKETEESIEDIRSPRQAERNTWFANRLKGEPNKATKEGFPKFDLYDSKKESTTAVSTEQSIANRSDPVGGDPVHDAHKKLEGQHKRTSDLHADRTIKALDPTFESLERQQLVHLAHERMSNSEYASFNSAMRAFEGRAHRDELTTTEVAQTYKQIERLLEKKGHEPVEMKNRVLLAEQVMLQAAHPMSIDQGQHGTCNVTTVECRLYSRCPSVAAKLVADIATTGEFITHDGTHIRPLTSDLTPDKEARKQTPLGGGDRTYASQVFQITALNIYYGRKTEDPSGKKVNQGDIVYTQLREGEKPGSSDDTGERVRDRAGHTLKDGSGKKLLDGGLTPVVTQDVNYQITGSDEKIMLQSSIGRIGTDGVAQVSSPEKLEMILRRNIEKKNLPLIVFVNCGQEPFATDSGMGSAVGKSDAWHFVNITGYNPETGDIYISNQYGDKKDHDGAPGHLKPLKAAELFKAMQSVKEGSRH